MSFEIQNEKWSTEKVREEALAYLASRPAPEPIVETPAPPRLPDTASAADRHYVYVVAAGGQSKIGYTTNLRLRLSNIRVDNPHATDVRFYVDLPMRVGRHLEQLIKASLNPLCIGGEWFAVPPDAMADLVKRIVAQLP